MGILQKLFGKSTDDHGLPHELRQRTDAKLALIQHLAECRPFAREGMNAYIALLEKSGVEVPRERRTQMLDAAALVPPVLQEGGNAADGYEQLRQAFLRVHLDELADVVKVIRQLPPHASTAAFLEKILDAIQGAERLAMERK